MRSRTFARSEILRVLVRGLKEKILRSMTAKVPCPNIVPVKPVYSVVEFCCQHGISRALFYKLLQSGQGPRVIKVGKRTLITNEAAEAWRRSRENAA